MIGPVYGYLLADAWLGQRRTAASIGLLIAAVATVFSLIWRSAGGPPPQRGLVESVPLLVRDRIYCVGIETRIENVTGFASDSIQDSGESGRVIPSRWPGVPSFNPFFNERFRNRLMPKKKVAKKAVKVAMPGILPESSCELAKH